MTDRVIHMCSFQSGPDIKRRTKYETVKAAVLKAGRFSVFEACESERSAAMFERLHRDAEIETFGMPFPWIGLRRRA